MKIAEVRQAIDALDSERCHLGAIAAADFIGCDVADRLQARIAEVAALPIPARFAREGRARDAVVANARDLIVRWRDVRGANIRPRRGGCCGR
jgi:hypothetical protein